MARTRHRPTAATTLPALVFGLCWLVGCADDADATIEGCGKAGERFACTCPNGASGTQLCLPSGETSACDCDAVRTVPCSAPGVAFDCSCEAGRTGTEVCRLDGRYSPCDCALDGASALDGGNGSMQPTGEPPMPAGCPETFVCTEQMGVRACVDDSGVPPLCATDDDCAGSGLPNASCVDPMIGGVLVCYQPC
jgi:hypothetical protein